MFPGQWGNGEKEPGSTCCGEFSGLGALGHDGMVWSSPQELLWGRSSWGEAGPCLTCHPQPQRGLLEHGTISEVAVEHPIVKSIDVVYPHCSLALGQPGPHKGRPSPISLHLLFLHVLPFIVYAHCEENGSLYHRGSMSSMVIFRDSWHGNSTSSPTMARTGLPGLKTVKLAFPDGAKPKELGRPGVRRQGADLLCPRSS